MRVGFCPVSFQFRQMLFRPFANRLQWLNQSPTERREGILDFGWNNRVDRPPDQPIPLEAAQGLGQHLLRNAANLTLQFRIAMGAVAQDVNDKRRPLVGDTIKDKTRKATSI